MSSAFDAYWARVPTLNHFRLQNGADFSSVLQLQSLDVDTHMDTITKVALRSKASGKFVRMDGHGITGGLDNGGGKVSVSNSIGPEETFVLERFPGDLVSFRSTVFNHIYLRLDGSSVPAGKKLEFGGGIVNCQFMTGPYEKYRIIEKATRDGTVGIENNEFRGRFLRMDASKNVVNVQGEMLSLEEWEILVIG